MMENQKTVNDLYEILAKNGIIQNLKTCRNTNPSMMGKGEIVYKDGMTYNIFDVKEEDFTIEMIARSLSNQCRYNGHTNIFYSTAQHSVRMSEAALLGYGDVKLSLACLLHDGGESLIGDIVHPFKRELPDSIIDIEKRIDAILYKKYGIEEYLDSKLVKFIDVQICNDEMDSMLNENSGVQEFILDICKKEKISLGSEKYVKGGIHANQSPYYFYNPDWSPENSYNRFISQFFKLSYYISRYSNEKCYCELGSHKETKECKSILEEIQNNKIK